MVINVRNTSSNLENSINIAFAEQLLYMSNEHTSYVIDMALGCFLFENCFEFYIFCNSIHTFIIVD